MTSLDPERRPAGIRKAVDLRTLDQEAFEDVTLLPGECRWSACGDGGLERIWATVTEAILPVADGAHRTPRNSAEFLGAVLLSLVQLKEVQSTFFKLSSGQVGWQPTVSHPVILPSFTSAEINKWGSSPTEAGLLMDLLRDMNIPTRGMSAGLEKINILKVK